MAFSLLSLLLSARVRPSLVFGQHFLLNELWDVLRSFFRLPWLL